jgi:hypothetical protein
MAKKAAPKKKLKVIKSAKDGKFKSKKFAGNHPNETYEQTIDKGKPKKKGG